MGSSSWGGIGMTIAWNGLRATVRAATLLAIAALVASPVVAQSTEQDEITGFFISPNEPEFSQVAFCSDCPSAVPYSDECGGCCDAGCSDGCCGDCGAGCCDLGTGCGDVCCNEPWMHRDSLYGTFLYLHPVGADMHHAQQQNGTGGAGTTPFGEIGVADPHAEQGIRVGGTLALGAC
ncbi:MAG: hypothetical protein ACR2NU_17065, partial [Aeoliella sp.]